MGIVILPGPEIEVHLSDGLGGISLISQGTGEGWRIFGQINAKGANTGVWILTGHDTASVGHAGGIGYVGICKPDPFAGQFVDIWGLQYFIACTSQVIASLLVSNKKDDVHSSSFYLFDFVLIISGLMFFCPGWN
jgi:hypothetical protein